ncbi:MAG: mandelate racemase/muconate lactonizing enzyme family protein [Granulosicoccus sp.]|nr:mandelate racemase/muconate lactonizing enzyme family protein [Granulosicoccus sp.]
MKISAIDVFVLKTPLEEPFAFSQGWVTQRAATLVRVSTDNGLTGWGEAFAQGLEPPEISAAVIEHALIPIVMGENPLNTSVLWHNMYNRTRDYGRKGSVIAAMSALDIAFWDICGKFYNQPVYQLLGGAVRTSVTPYATGFYRLSGQQEADRLAEEARQHQAAGFKAMKIKLGFGVDDDIEVMRSIQAALLENDSDNDIELMVDTNHAYGFSEALRLGRELENYRLRWYEEPLVPEDINGMARLRNALSIPIAAGENEHTPYGFHALINAEAIDVAQPDIGSCGGITAARDITAMAQAAGLMVNPHVWGSAVAQAASLQWLATLPVPHHSLYPVEPLLEYDRSSHPFRQQLVEEPWTLQNGQINIPDKAGLGIDVNMNTVEQFVS